MKVALCYYGNTGWKPGSDGSRVPLQPDICYSSVKQHIIDVNDQVDVFIHSWSTDLQMEIINTLKPVKYLIENQREFPEAVDHKNSITSLADLKSAVLEKIRLYLNSSLISDRVEGAKRVYSRWYSTKKVIELKKTYEHEHDFKYDMVMLIRLDIEFYTDINFRGFDKSCFYCSDTSDLHRIRHNYLARNGVLEYQNINLGIIKKPIHETIIEKLGLEKSVFFVQPKLINALQAKIGLGRYVLSDTWFIASSEKMDEFGMLFDRLKCYRSCSHIASFQHAQQIFDYSKFKFRLEQFTDFEIYRFSQKVSVPHNNF